MLFVLLSHVISANYAVLIAGSKDYSNYRHQSDVFQMYQILISNGFAPQNIILMAYNDIVNNAKNPFKGKIFNMKLITSVYPGDDKIDYKGDLVTGNNFINVITGRKTAQVKKVLTSTANDNVFIYYCDHGAKGLVAMPTGGCLTGHVLRQAVLLMKQKKMFKKLFIAIDSSQQCRVIICQL